MSKSDYNNINIPKSIDEAIEKGAKRAIEEKYVKLTRKRTVQKIAAVVACTLTIGTLAINSENVMATIKSTIDFFSENKDFKYSSDQDTIEKFNDVIAVTAEDNGIKLTVDNVALDDNYLNVFYTIESNTSMGASSEGDFATAKIAAPDLNYKINNEYIESGNHWYIDSYFESDNILKVMERINISFMNIPSDVQLSIGTDRILGKDGQWSIDVLMNKDDVLAQTTTVNPKLKAEFNVNDTKHDVTIEKISISPFGSQVVLSQYVKDNNLFDSFAIYDDKGESLDVLSTDVSISSEGEETKNSFEFIKAKEDIQFINLVPIQYDGLVRGDMIVHNINDYPVNFEISSEGSILVEKVEAEGKKIKITYKKDGVTLGNPEFELYDSFGNEFEENEKAFLEYSVNRETGQYIATFEFYNDSVDTSKVAKLGLSPQDFSVLRDQSVKVEIK